MKTQQTKNDPADRKAWKFRLVRGLYEQGISSKDVRELFRLIDWLMELPEPLEDSFFEDVTKFTEENRMPFISTPERVGFRKGLREGIRHALKIRFGSDGLELMPDIEAIHYEEQLRAILTSLETAADLEGVRRLLASLRC